MGIFLTTQADAAAAIAEGRLVPPLEDWAPRLPDFFLYHPSRRHIPPALKALIDFLREYPRPRRALEVSRQPTLS